MLIRNPYFFENFVYFLYLQILTSNIELIRMDFILRPDSHLHSSMSVLLASLDYIISFAHFLQLRILSLSSKWIFNLVFRRKNPVVGMVKMASWRLPKGYPFCTKNSSYSFQDKKLLYCRSILHISELCILLEFWFLKIFFKNTSCWT